MIKDYASMTQQQPVTVSIYAQTDVGKIRQNNEDNFLIADLTREDYRTATDDEQWSEDLITFQVGEKGFIAAVSDGMGGALAGEVASDLAVHAVRLLMLKLQSMPEYAQLPFSEQFRLAIEQTNKLIHIQSQASPQFAGMGATFTGLGFFQGRAYLAQVGDSRAYVIRGNQIVQATKDQSLVGQLVDAGYLTEEQAQEHVYKNVILQALGAQPDTEVVVDRLTLYRDDVILLCSDGLSNKVQGSMLAEVIRSCSDLKRACQELINMANERGGEDNITVVLCEFSGDGLPAPTDPLDFDLERMKRQTTLPVNLIPDLLDPKSLLAEALKKSDHPVAELEAAAASSESDTNPDQVMRETNDSSFLESPQHETDSAERNIVPILIGLLIVVFVGAVLAVAWYIKTWKDKDQSPQETPARPMTLGPRAHDPILPLIGGCLYQFPT
ncbi:MAG: serine/threonine-protein phosphatase [Acidobacteria bacterium]|nr:serine/threonine-protein phosphatase [Acidobacteriota bacterium]